MIMEGAVSGEGRMGIGNRLRYDGAMNVVAALIERDGMVLICQRKAGQRHAGKWEFPGGKVEPDEDFTTALERELFEELAIKATVGDEVARYQYTYPGRSPIQLIFYTGG